MNPKCYKTASAMDRGVLKPAASRKQKNGLVGLSITPDDLFILERPRVNTLLENAIMNSVVLVTAGEGYGKTTAVHSFLRKRNDTTIWIPFSERDNDPEHFWESITNAEGFYNPHVQKALEETGFPETSGQFNRCYQVLSEAVSENVLARTRRKIPDNTKHIIIADNCHLIRGESILNFAKRIMAFPFPRMTIILISRTELELNTMPLLSKGLLSRITSADLSFNAEEIKDYFRLKNINLNKEEPEKIFADTEGWVEALNLIAEEMKNGQKRYSRSLRDRGSFRNMEETLFASIPVSLQYFLVILSLFDQWPLEALEKIAAALPEKLPGIKELTGNMYQLSSLIHYDAYLHGFRIHRAFLDYLGEKQKELSREDIKTACSIFAEWCKKNNLYIDAAVNYGIAGDYEKLITVIYSFPRLMSRPAAASLLEILDRIIEHDKQNKNDATLLFLRHVTRAGMLTNLGRYEESRASLLESIRKFEALPPSPLSSRILSACYNSLGPLSLITYRQTRDLRWTLEYFQRGNYYYMRSPYPVFGPGTKTSLGSYMNLVGQPPRKGEFEKVISTIARCIPHASYSINGYLSGADSLCRAELAFFKGDLNAAEQHGRKAVFTAHEKEQYEIESKSLFYLHRVHLCNGNAAAGRETLEQMEAQLDIPGYTNRYAIYDITAGWFYAHTGGIEKIAPWLRNEFEESDLNLLFHNFETMVKAKSLFAEKKYQGTLDFLHQKKVREGIGSFHLGMMEITALEAVVRCRAEDEAGALKTLETAYMMSLPNSLNMPFIELGEDMRTLAGIALNSKKHAIPWQWLEMIRNRASVYAKKLFTVIEYYKSGSSTDELPFFSSQELLILEGISRGFTREKIAHGASLSINSLKSIIKTIYGKLGAFNSADAIRIASGLGLLKNSSSWN